MQNQTNKAVLLADQRPYLPLIRWLELLALFVAGPLVLALALPPSAMYPALIAACIVGAVLLHFTPGFRWRSLSGSIQLKAVALFGVITLLLASLLCLWLLPERLFFLPRQNPAILLMIAAAYPLILVLPQEVLYRPLFYRRYGHLFGSQNRAVWANAVLFSLAHLMYWHWLVFLLTFIGSFVFSHAYLKQNSFPQALALHSVAGVMIFASGLGWLFYSGGNVAQVVQ